jgi:lysozyme
MTASPACLAHIKRREDELGFLSGRCTHLKAYRCPAGVWTCGWGTTRGVGRDTEWTQHEADRRFLEAVGEVEADLPKVVKAPLSQGQWDGLVALTYNLKGGPLALPRIAPKLTAHLNAGEYAKAANEFLTINRANGRVLTGLIARRVEERAMFLGLQGANGSAQKS